MPNFIDVSDRLDDVFGDIFDFEFPSKKASEKARLPSLEAPDVTTGVSNHFEPELPESAARGTQDDGDTESSAEAAFATVTDFGPLLAPGGGGGKPDNGGGGGGGGKPDGGGGGGGGGKGGKGPAAFISGDADTDTQDNFNILIEYSGDFSSAAATALVRYIEASAEFLSNIITTGFTDDPGMFRPGNTRKTFEVDDLYVQVSIGSFGIQPIGAATEVYAGNDWNNNGVVDTPAGATIIFNGALLDALEAAGTLDDVALHEMIHTLGFGLWEVFENNLTDETTGRYTGASAVGTVVEDEGLVGSVGSHWAESVYGAELMTSVVQDTDIMYLADFSIASLQDLAVVNADGSTGYQLAGDYSNQIAALNGASGADGGIDLDAWALTIA